MMHVLRLIGATFLLMLVLVAQGQERVRIGLYEADLPSEVRISIVVGGYEWVAADGRRLAPVLGPTTLRVADETLMGLGNPLEYVHVRPTIPQSRLELRTPGGFPTVHAGSLHFLVERGRIRCILEAPLERYLQGVLSAESGKGHHPEYYRAQAIVSRTYTVQAEGRHRMQGFDLCDAVHCQAYHGLGTVNDTLEFAVESTASTVLVDRSGRPITAAFHSNCGGYTQGAENVWQRRLEYLVGVPDTFCLAMPHAQWTQAVPSEAWRNWLDARRGSGSSRTTFLPNERMDLLPDSGGRIRAAEARTAFGLQSSYFVTVDDGMEVRFMGHGFGHGVGLCQEGAMERARHGSTAADILHHYYTGVRLTSLDALDVFLESK